MGSKWGSKLSNINNETIFLVPEGDKKLLVNENIKNTFDINGQVVRLTRRGFPTFTNLKFNQQNILLVYPFSDIVNLELDITDGVNPTRIIFLCLKDGRRIALTPSNQLNDLLFLEGRAIFIAKLLIVEL